MSTITLIKSAERTPVRELRVDLGRSTVLESLRVVQYADGHLSTVALRRPEHAEVTTGARRIENPLPFLTFDVAATELLERERTLMTGLEYGRRPCVTLSKLDRAVREHRFDLRAGGCTRVREYASGRIDATGADMRRVPFYGTSFRYAVAQVRTWAGCAVVGEEYAQAADLIA